jgi:CubicO group peptidase (beta-lactamase class C family)
MAAAWRWKWRSAPIAVAVMLAAAGCTHGSNVASSPAMTASPQSATPARPAAGASQSASFPAKQKISAYLNALSAHGHLSGTVLVTRDALSYGAAFGFADRRTKAPNTLQTAFRLGSVSKQFTAMGILLLQARHLLNVSDRLCRYLPGCPSRWQAITIEELLTHTSGIPDYLNDLRSTWPPGPTAPGQLIASFRGAPLHFPPGTRMRYSNSGYVLLGALIEHITGQPLAAFLQQNIFGRLGMTHTGTDTTGIRPGHARGYYADGQQPGLYPMSAFFADGGLYSTVADMQRWDSAVQHSTLIPAALTDQMLALHAACPPPGSPGGCLTPTDLGYGYGWFIDNTSHGRLYQHVGHIDGYFSFNGIYPAQNEHIIILANSESTRVLAISDALAALTLS